MKYLLPVILFLGSTFYCNSQTLQPPTPKQLAAEKQKAAKGNPEALFHMGLYYYYGAGVVKNYVTASQWLQKAAAKGSVPAMELLGDMYEEGEGVTRDIPKALTWLKKAADNGSNDAAFEIGTIYEAGYGIAENMPEAVKWYKVAAEKDNPEAMISLAFCYMDGDGIAADRAAGVQWFTRAANRGNRQAMRFLGEYYTEQEMGNDCAKAIEWYMKAADAGDTQSVKPVGAMTLEGNCAGINKTEVAAWMQRHADMGDEEACYNMAGFYLEGIGVAKDPGKAMELLIKDKEIRNKTGVHRNNSTNNIFLLYNSGDLDAAQMARLLAWMEESAKKTDDDEMMAVIANIYLNKEDAQVNDYRLAMDYAMKSAAKGNPGGCFWVGFIYSKGYGDIKKNEKKAFTWMQKSADKGDKDAMKMLSTFYAKGIGVEKSPALAEEWDKKAGRDE